MLMLQPKTILHINVTRIGDTLLATPVIRAMAHAWPEANITCLGHPGRVELIENLPFVHKVGNITKKTAPWQRGWFGPRYDLAVVHNFDEALVWYALRVADKVVAFRQRDERLNSRMYRCVQRPVLDTVHAVDVQLPLIQSLGLAPDGRQLSYQVTASEKAAAQQRLHQHGLDARRPLIGPVLESFPTKPYRDWPVEHFVQACQQVSLRYPQAQFILLGGDVTPAKIQAMRTALGERVTVFAGQLSLRESGAVMSCLDLYLGVDTGPTHLAGALQIPMVAMYHCLHRGYILAPLDHPALRVLEHPASNEDASAQRSMAEISVESVTSSMLELLATRYG